MSPASLLLRESTITSLTSIVEKSHHQKPPLPEFDLQLNSNQLTFVLTSKPICHSKITADEGFESDVDTLSIISSDDSFSSGNLQENNLKINQETDSGNGSASSDSDTEVSPPQQKVETTNNNSNESYNLVDCMCYTDIKFPNILVFVIRNEALVFRFKNLDNLQTFYTNFSTFKAVANQKAYSKTLGPKFNLLQRTDNDGVTHIEVTKELQTKFKLQQKGETSNIISLSAPECTNKPSLFNKNPRIKDNSPSPINNHFTCKKESNYTLKDANLRQQSESLVCDGRFKTRRSSSIENILDLQDYTRTLLKIDNYVVNKNRDNNNNLKKVWNSAEDLLDTPKRPERRRKQKPKAPSPPENKYQQDIMRGQYVRVNVENNRPFIIDTKDNMVRLQKVKEYSANFKPIEVKYQQIKYVEPKKAETRYHGENSWTNSIPRFLRKPRSHSETRNFTPMAYRYIDTTQSKDYYKNDHNTVSNRLFGMSSKLKDFSSNTNTINRKCDNWETQNGALRRSSLGELTYKINSSEGSLKSVIKKDDNKRRNEKKVTFSAYTTVQVV